MKHYIFFFRYHNSPPFEYHKIFIKSVSNESAITAFHTVFSAAGYLPDLENQTFSLMGERAYMEDITTNPDACNIQGFSFMFGNDPFEDLLNNLKKE